MGFVMKFIPLFFMLFIFGCGSGPVLVTVDEITPLEMETRYPNKTGWAEWDWAKSPSECTIYMMPKDEYGKIEEYHRVLGHELRHCFEGDFHE